MGSETHNQYVLGHSEEELRRLEEQARFFGDLTSQVFREAGLRDGMHVLDVGSGAGDVSFLARQFVGPTGSVLGVDRSEDAVTNANTRARSSSTPNVRFVSGDVSRMDFQERFDAIVGRLVLMYHPDPADVVRHLAGHLNPGGLMIFHEIDASHVLSEPPVPLFQQIGSWIVGTLAASGADPIMGLKLYQTFAKAGLPGPRMIVTGRAEGGPDSPVYEVFADLVRSLLPAADRFNIVRPDEVGIDTLAERLRDQVCAADGIILCPLLIGAWTTKPAAPR